MTEEMNLELTPEEIELKSCDIVMLINSYLEGKEIDSENDSFNIVDGLLYSFYFKNIPKPSNAELLSFKVSSEQKQSQEKINEEAEIYLKETDYHVFKMMELGTPMPEGMSVLRQQARERIVRL